MHAVFGGIPIISTSFPDGFGKPPRWHTKALPLEPHVVAWLLEKLDAVELLTWFPAPGQPSRLGHARIMLEAVGTIEPQQMCHAAHAVRTTLNAHDTDAILVQNGDGNLTLLIPFADAPHYEDVRAHLHEVTNTLAAQQPGLFSTEPNTRGANLIHLHVTHNAVHGYSALPYALRAHPDFPVNLPIAWSDLERIPNGSVTAATFPAYFHGHGDTLFAEHRRLADQTFARKQRTATPRLTVNHSRGTTISAALQILADGISRSAQTILDEGVQRGLLVPTYKAKYVYTALIEYITRANGNGRKAYIVQDESRNFRINEPPDDWPNLNPPQPPAPDAAAQALVTRLAESARGSNPTAFEVAVCDTFAHLGFLATHVGGAKAPDGYADATLGPLGYRVMIECKTGKGEVSQPDAFEAAKYRDAFSGQFCTLIGPAFPDEVELTRELHTHGVSAWTLDDLITALQIRATAYELRTCFAPGYATDALTDLAWDRIHGRAKRIRVIADLVTQEGLALQTAAARSGPPADAPHLTIDTAMALVDQRLIAAGSTHACTRDDVEAAFAYLANPLVVQAVTPAPETLVITRA